MAKASCSSLTISLCECVSELPLFLLFQGNLEDAFSLYEQAIAIEKGKEHSQTLPMLFAQYSRFVYLVCWKTEVKYYAYVLVAFFCFFFSLCFTALFVYCSINVTYVH